ncbi:MAG: peroxiredoxin family protein [Blastocatellia bacterium]
MSRKIKSAKVLPAAIAALCAIQAFAQAPATTLQSIDGAAINLTDLKGKVVVLSFGGSWVPLATKELPALQKLADRFASREVRIYWVSINSAKPGARTYATDADLKAFAAKNGFTLPVLRDPEQKLYKELGLDVVPTIIILDKQGQVARKQAGFGTEAGEAYGELIRDIEQLLK